MPMLEEKKEIENASVFERIIAAVLDLLVFFSAWFWSYYLIISSGKYIAPWQQDVYYWFFVLFFVAYASYFNSGGRQTLGKYLMGIKVVDVKTLGPLQLGRGVLRSLSYIFNVLTLSLGFLISILNLQGRAAEDYIAGTRVIRLREKSPAEQITVAALGIVLFALTLFYFYAALVILPSSADKRRIDAANTQLENIAYLEHVHKVMFGKYTEDIARLALISGDAVQFQRDVQGALKRRGFAIGARPDGFTIKAAAKDSKDTPVKYTFNQ